jgi:hypothetical protein
VSTRSLTLFPSLRALAQNEAFKRRELALAQLAQMKARLEAALPHLSSR